MPNSPRKKRVKYPSVLKPKLTAFAKYTHEFWKAAKALSPKVGLRPCGTLSAFIAQEYYKHTSPKSAAKRAKSPLRHRHHSKSPSRTK